MITRQTCEEVQGQVFDAFGDADMVDQTANLCSNEFPMAGEDLKKF